jgi:hypothetical protein
MKNLFIAFIFVTAGARLFSQTSDEKIAGYIEWATAEEFKPREDSPVKLVRYAVKIKKHPASAYVTIQDSKKDEIYAAFPLIEDKEMIWHFFISDELGHEVVVAIKDSMTPHITLDISPADLIHRFPRKKTEPNQSPETTTMADTPAASHPSRQP